MIGLLSSVEIARDWLDYVGLAVGLVGGIAALVALALARQSASDASQSRNAAEASAAATQELLGVAREEAEALRRERGRRPALRVSLAAEHPPDRDAFGDPVVVTVTVHNDGDRDADGTELRLMISDEVASIMTCVTEFGEDPEKVAQQVVDALVRPGGPATQWTSATVHLGISAGSFAVRHFLVQAQPGIWSLSASVFHERDPAARVVKLAQLNLSWKPNEPLLLGQA